MMHVSKRFSTMIDAQTALQACLQEMHVEEAGCCPAKDAYGKQTGEYAAWVSVWDESDMRKAIDIMTAHGALP